MPFGAYFFMYAAPSLTSGSVSPLAPCIPLGSTTEPDAPLSQLSAQPRRLSWLTDADSRRNPRPGSFAPEATFRLKTRLALTAFPGPRAFRVRTVPNPGPRRSAPASQVVVSLVMVVSNPIEVAHNGSQPLAIVSRERKSVQPALMPWKASWWAGSHSLTICQRTDAYSTRPCPSSRGLSLSFSRFTFEDGWQAE